MKVTKQVDYPLVVKATLRDDGEVQLSLSATVPYGNRTATGTLDKFPKELLKEVKVLLRQVIENHAGKAVTLAEQAAAVSMIAAINLGEKV